MSTSGNAQNLDLLAVEQPHDSNQRACETVGVVNCVAYSAGRRVGDVALPDISEILKEPDRFVWIGLNEPSAGLLRNIQEEFGLHDLAIEDALRAHQRPKLERYGDGLFLVMRTPRLSQHPNSSSYLRCVKSASVKSQVPEKPVYQDAGIQALAGLLFDRQ
jgi:hypothetical protein